MTIHALITNFTEIFAVFSGLYFLSKNRKSSIRYFVYFLILTVCVEIIASYTHLYGKLEFLNFLKNTRFKSNFWLFNIYIVFSLFFYLMFYIKILEYNKHKKILKWLTIISVVVIFFNIYNGWQDFFKTNLTYNFIWTTFSVFICVVLYFYELLISDKILKFYKLTTFYISIGLLLWWLVFPLVAFYLPYYKGIYPEIIRIKGIILISTNVYLYSCYSIGFLWGKME